MKPNTRSRLKQSLVLAAGLSCSATVLASASYDSARVLSASPVYETVTVEVPQEQCYNEEVPVRDTRHRRGSLTPTIVGAVIGGAIGNAVGHKKRNRQVGTAVGALLGGSIGADIGRQNRRGGEVVRYRTERVCEVTHELRHEQEVVGYDVRYAYAGGTYHTRMPYHPGDTLRVRVRVTPAE